MNNNEFDNSPMLAGNQFISAEKPSITFHQLKSKYGNVNTTNHNLRENYEDIKEGDNEYFRVPEEHEEEPPLRLKT